MFSRAVVVEFRRGLAPPDEVARGKRVHGFLRPADEVSRREPPPREKALRHPDVSRLAAVRGAQESDLRGPEAESLRPAGLEQRHGLKGLRRGPGKDQAARVPAPGNDVPLGAHHRRVTAVAGLEEVAAKDPCEKRGAGHRRVLSEAREARSEPKKPRAREDVGRASGRDVVIGHIPGDRVRSTTKVQLNPGRPGVEI